MVKMEHTVRGDERLAARMAEPLLRALYLGEHSLLRAHWPESPLFEAHSQSQLVRASRNSGGHRFLRKK